MTQKKESHRRLALSRETLTSLTKRALDRIAGGFSEGASCFLRCARTVL